MPFKVIVTVHGFSVQRFRVQNSAPSQAAEAASLIEKETPQRCGVTYEDSAVNAEPKTGNVYQDVYDHVGRTRATIRGFIKYLITYEQGQQRNVTLNGEL